MSRWPGWRFTAEQRKILLRGKQAPGRHASVNLGLGFSEGSYSLQDVAFFVPFWLGYPVPFAPRGGLQQEFLRGGVGKLHSGLSVFGD